MSTDGEAPLTRAQLRALRAAAEAAEAAQDAEAAGAAEPSAAERSEGDPDGTAARAEESRHAETTEEATAASPAAPPTIRHPVPAPGIVPRPAWPAPASQHPEQPHPAPEAAYLLAIRLRPTPCLVEKIAPAPGQNDAARAAADARRECSS